MAWMAMIIGLDPAKRNRRYLTLLDEIDAGTALAGGRALAVSDSERGQIRKTLAMPNYSNRSYRLFVLLRLNAAIDGDDKVRELPHATVEHVFPRRPDPASLWLKDFRTPDEAKRFCGAFGNMALLIQDDQHKTANRDYAEKRPVLARSDYALTRWLAERDSWRPHDIGRNTDDMTDLLLASWGLA